MKKNFIILGTIVFCFLTFGLSKRLSAEETETTAFTSGIVSSISDGQIVVSEYDYDQDQDVDISYAIDQTTEFNNVNSAKDIAIGDSVDIVYEVLGDGRRKAQSVTVEKASVDDEPDPSEQDPQTFQNDQQPVQAEDPDKT